MLVPNCPVPNCPFLLCWCQIVLVPNCPVPNCPGAKLSGCQIVHFYYLGAKLSAFIILVPNCPLYYLGAKLSSAKLSYNLKKGIGHFYEPGYCICEDSLFANFALRGLFYKILYLSVSLNFNWLKVSCRLIFERIQCNPARRSYFTKPSKVEIKTSSD